MDTLSPGAGPIDAPAAAVLREVAARLQRLAREPDFSDAIDLHSLPLGESGRKQLRQHLGQGEVDCALQVAGATRICETAYAGAWWVRHADADDRTQHEQIVIARVPALLLAHPDDIGDAARRLAEELAAQACQEIS
jgi:hydrogenase-1 operon protein HyaF